MSVVNTNWAYAASAPATGVSTSITLDKAAGNNRMVVVTVAIFDNNSEVHTVTLDPGGTPVVATPLFDPSGRGIIKGADVVVNQVGIFYILDTDLPAGTGTFDVAVTWAAGVNNDTRIGVFYCEDMAQSVPALHGYTEHILTTDIATTISIAASTEVFEVLAQREIAQTFTAGVSNGNTVLFDHINSTEPPQALSAYGTGETDLDWTLGTAANVMQAYAVFEASGTTLSATSGSITLTGGDATLSATGVVSEAPTTWFSGEWWKTPTFSTTWFPLAGNVTLSAEPSAVTITGGNAELTDTTGSVTLDVDLGTVTLTGGDAKLSVPLPAVAGVITFTGGDATFSIETSSDLFDLSKVGTFDNLGIVYGKDVAYNINTDIAYKVESRRDVDTITLDGIFGTPPQQYQILTQISETTVPARMEYEFNGTQWVLISNTPLGL